MDRPDAGQGRELLPARAPRRAEARLQFYASQFPLVEVDSTYYFPPSEKNSVLWIERTPPDFTFNIKAYSLLTNHPTKPDSLYKDLAGAVPPEAEKRQRLPGRSCPTRRSTRSGSGSATR